MKRVGLLGGTFNPPHLGHLKLAEIALAGLALDEVRFIPNALPPHKPAPKGPDGPGRRRLLEEALAPLDPRFRVEPIELERSGPSYTVDTLEALAAREPGTGWIFLMGADQAATFPKWRRPEAILALASLAVVGRPGAGGELPELLITRVRTSWSGGPGEVVCLPSTELDLASTGLRADLGRGATPEGIPPQVMAVILQENQYR